MKQRNTTIMVIVHGGSNIMRNGKRRWFTRHLNRIVSVSGFILLAVGANYNDNAPIVIGTLLITYAGLNLLLDYVGGMATKSRKGDLWGYEKGVGGRPK